MRGFRPFIQTFYKKARQCAKAMSVLKGRPAGVTMQFVAQWRQSQALLANLRSPVT